MALANITETDSTINNPSDSFSVAPVDSTGKMDVIDLFEMIIKKKSSLHKNKNKNDNGPFITVIPYPGYTLATGFAAVVPINISFYTNRREKGRLSFFNNNAQYTQYNQIVAQSLSNLYTKQDKWELLGDWRYFKFPTYTYGLGSHTSATDEDRIDYSHIRLYEVVMRKISKTIDLGLGYSLDYHWNIKDYDADVGEATDFVRYGITNKSTSSGITANFLYDNRNDENNASKGTFIFVQVRNNLKFLGSDSYWNSLVIDFRKYFSVPTKHWKSTIAVWLYQSYTLSGKPPYLDLPSTGWDTYNNTGRGYVMGRYRGFNMFYLEAEYRFTLMKNGFLGGVVFANIESLAEFPNIKFTGVQPGIGLGLRIKINKHTNTNAAADYGFGSNGSKGFAFNLNEVF